MISNQLSGKKCISVKKGNPFIQCFSILAFLFALFVILISGTVHAYDGQAANTTPAELLSAYVQIPSVSGEEEEAGEFFSRVCRDHGLHVHVFTDEPDSYNFAASLYPLDQRKPNIVFLTHIDVVPPGEPEGWTYPPFSGKIADGKVWGRGAIDNKAMGVMQFFAIKQFVELAASEDLPYNISMLAVSGEETGGDKGARIIASQYLEELNPVAVYGEGGAGLGGLVRADPEKTVFGVEVIQKRRMFLEITSQATTSGHGSIPRSHYSSKDVVKATSALLESKPKVFIAPIVRDALQVIAEYEQGILKRVMQRIHFYGPILSPLIRRDPLISSMLTNTITLTHVKTSEGAYNQIPTRTRAVFDCRLLPGTSEDDFLDQVKTIVMPYKVDVNVLQSSPESPVSPQGEYYKAMEESIMHVFNEAVVVPFMFVAINDNRFFRRQGVPSYGLLPAIMSEELMESIHYFDERFPIDELDKGIEVYARLIKNLLELEEPITGNTEDN